MTATHTSLFESDSFDSPSERTPVNPREFVRAGNAIFTVQSKRTDRRFTYRVVQKKDKSAVWFVSVLRGPDNVGDYAFIGSILGDQFKRSLKSRVGADAPSVIAFAWLWPILMATGKCPERAVFYHVGRCCRCGRRLTTPSSILRGMGDECAAITGTK